MCIRRKQPTERRWISRIAAVAPAERWYQITWACTANCTPPWKLISKHVKTKDVQTDQSRLFKDIPMWHVMIFYGMVLDETGLSHNGHCGLLSYLVMWVTFLTVVYLIVVSGLPAGTMIANNQPSNLANLLLRHSSNACWLRNTRSRPPSGHLPFARLLFQL